MFQRGREFTKVAGPAFDPVNLGDPPKQPPKAVAADVGEHAGGGDGLSTAAEVDTSPMPLRTRTS
jgi:hypothetical protein